MTEPSNAKSALNLRLVLAVFGLVLGAALAVVAFGAGLTLAGVVLALLALVALFDIAVIQRRRAARPGGHDSLFE